MRLFDNIGNTLKALRVYLFGKGFMTLAVLTASAVAHVTGFGWVLPVIAIGGVALTAVNRFYRESLYQDEMIDLYRDDIASHLGIAPQQVTRAHLKEAAKGNEVIDQALKRQRNKTWLAIGAATLSSAITTGLILFFGADTKLHHFVAATCGDTIGVLANFIGIGTVSAITGLIFNTGLREAVEFSTPVGKASAHDRILELEYAVKRGLGITKEQVYGVLVAGDPLLQQRIRQTFHESYNHMTPIEQAAVLRQIGVAAEMQTLAQEITHGTLRPGHLAYMIGDIRPAMRHDSAAEAPHGNFVEKLGLTPRENQRFTDRVTAREGYSPSL